MATKRKYMCKKCGSEQHAGSLFDALLRIANGDKTYCTTCNTKHHRLQLEFDFGLGATHSTCDVLHCFTSTTPRKWPYKKKNMVKFYPFLVILRRHGKKRAIWLPYWHVVVTPTRTIKKYGQWAPFMDEDLFEDLLRKAKRADKNFRFS